MAEGKIVIEVPSSLFTIGRPFSSAFAEWFFVITRDGPRIGRSAAFGPFSHEEACQVAIQKLGNLLS